MSSFDERERREARYPLNLSVTAGVPDGPRIWAKSQNISSRGILLTTPTPIRMHSRIDLRVHLPLQVSFGLSNIGKVVRVEQGKKGAFAVAVSCKLHFKISTMDPIA
jgi:hypothetical protein